MAEGPPGTALRSSANLSMAAQGSVFCTDNTACFKTDSPNLSIVVGILLEIVQSQTPRYVQEHPHLLLSASFLAVHLQHLQHSNSSLQYKTHGGKTENFALLSLLSHKLLSMSPNERHSPSVCAGTTCPTAHTNLASIDQRFRNHLPAAWERLKSIAKSLYLQERSRG